MSHISRGALRAFSGGVLCAVTLGIAGCGPLFDFGPVAPISLNFAEGKVSVIVCLRDVKITDVLAEYRQEDGTYGVLMKTADASPAQGVAIPFGGGFELGEPLPPLVMMQLNAPPKGVAFDHMTIRLAYESENGGGYTWPTFPRIDPSLLNSDEYVYSNGRVREQPCDLR